MIDRTPLIEGARALLAFVSPWIQEVSVLEWDGTQGFLPIIRRSLLRRQFEFLNVIVDLTESKRGYAAVPLLRPACEELLWLEYLNTLSLTDAQALANCMIRSGIQRDLDAQAGEVGDEVMADMGLAKPLAQFRSEEPDIRREFTELGTRLNWPSHFVSKGTAPSVWFIAKASGHESLYSFLYHATSRYVHFSPVELARRGWGRPGKIEVSSDNYEPVWAAFSLSWSTRLFGLTLNASLQHLESEGVAEPDFEGLQAAFEKIMDVTLIPLITPDELRWDPNA